MESLLESRGLPVSDPTLVTALTCPYDRGELLTRLGVLAETHVLALKNVVDEEVFVAVCDFPVELIGQNVNGYRRFLAEMGNSAETQRTVAGFILRLRAAMVYEFGPTVMTAMEKEMLGLKGSQLDEALGRPDDPSLWSVAYPTQQGVEIDRSWDILVTFLFLSHAKWLLVRAGATLAESDPKKK